MIRKLLLLLALLAALSLGTVYLSLRLSLSLPGGDYDVAGLTDSVEIRFDPYLRPFIDARNLNDALFAEGWLHARYRLWQMELLRRAGNGRLAEGLGKDLLAADESLWRAGVPQLARRLEMQASSATLGSVEAYVAGINAALDRYKARPPELLLAGIEPAPWTPRDVFAVGAIIAFQSANNMGKERLRLSLASALEDEYFAAFLPDEAATPGFPYVLKDPRLIVGGEFFDSLDAFEQLLMPNASLGSSGWAVAPARSASGNALFAFDSHDALNLPNLFYEVHLFYGAGKSIRGWSLPGLPGVINGFNERLAWGMTNIGDTQDLYVETHNPDNPREFLFAGEWHEASSQTVTIPVKGGDPVEIEILMTANGPLVEEEPAISLRWTGHDLAGGGIETLLAMNTAGNWQEFEAALDQHGAPTANITYADRDNRIAFRTIGVVPVRGSGRGLVPLAGDRAAHGWTGFVAAGELPALIDPEYGYVAAANARVHDGEPLISADNAPGYRIQRLQNVLSSRGDFTLDDMRALQLDGFNVQAHRLLPHMLPVTRDVWEDAEDVGIDWLTDWLDDPQNSADSTGALIWEHWYPRLARELFGSQLEEDLLRRLLRESYVVNQALDHLIVSHHDSPWWQGRREVILRDTLVDTLQQLARTHGPDLQSWRWDAAHTVSFRHELHGISGLTDRWLSRGPYPWGGGHPVLARARYSYDRLFEGRAGATVRVIAEMSEPIKVRAVIPGGQHGHPSSEWYDDQLQTWLDGELIEIASAPGEVDGVVTTLRPVAQP